MPTLSLSPPQRHVTYIHQGVLTIDHKIRCRFIGTGFGLHSVLSEFSSYLKCNITVCMVVAVNECLPDLDSIKV